MKPGNEKSSPVGAIASWTAPALWRFGGIALPALRAKSGRWLPQPKASRKFGNLFRGARGGIFVAFSIHAASLPSDWRGEQSFDVSNPGLVKFSLPVETLAAARPALEDLRLYDDAGNEVPYLTERPAPVAKVVQPAKSFQAVLNANTTVLTLETGLAQALDGITLETPAQNFIKAVRIEGSADGKTWHTFAQGQPIFRQSYGASQLHLSFPAGVAKWLRLTVDDQRSSPVPFTGARVHAAASKSVPTEWMPVAITERVENPGETRLALNLGAANLNLASVQIETAEPLFLRQASLAVPQIAEDAIREQAIGQGAVYRVAAEKLSVPLEDQVRSREMFLLIQNGDSPPLPINAVRVERWPVYLVFFAKQPGAYHLLAGNARCAAPHYDLAALGMDLKRVPVSPVKIPPPVANPDFRAPEVLPGLGGAGVALDVSDWKFRKPVKISGGGAQQVEFDLDVLAHAQPGFADLRLLHGSNQVAYILQRTSIRRALTPAVTATNDVKRPQLSRWIIKLPRAGLPLTRLTCAARTPLFERSLSLYEELTDERGNQYRHQLGSASWMQTPERKANEFALTLNDPPQSDMLILETENGDNPPIELEKFTAFYPATRALFKAGPDDELFLYYGNPQMSAPRYDLSLVAGELLSADKKMASLSGEQQLKQSSWRDNQVPGKGGVIFWGILALVVVGLLVVISKLLPKSPMPPQT